MRQNRTGDYSYLSSYSPTTAFIFIGYIGSALICPSLPLTAPRCPAPPPTLSFLSSHLPVLHAHPLSPGGFTNQTMGMSTIPLPLLTSHIHMLSPIFPLRFLPSFLTLVSSSLYLFVGGCIVCPDHGHACDRIRPRDDP